MRHASCQQLSISSNDDSRRLARPDLRLLYMVFDYFVERYDKGQASAESQTICATIEQRTKISLESVSKFL